MPRRVLEFQTTPNPNALKCVLDGPIRTHAQGPASFRSRAESAGDPLAEALFAVEGVTSLLINENWITVNKSPTADWPAVKRGVARAIELRGAP